jgi:hypothetical protein
MKWMPGTALVEQPLAQRRGLFDAERAHGRRIVRDLGELVGQRLSGTVPPDSCSDRWIVVIVVTGMTPARIGTVAAVRSDAVAQPQVVVGVEEHLGDGVVSAARGTSRRTSGVALDVRRARVPVRERRHPHREVAVLAQQPHEIGGVEDALGVRDPLAQRIAGRSPRIASMLTMPAAPCDR